MELGPHTEVGLAEATACRYVAPTVNPAGIERGVLPKVLLRLTAGSALHARSEILGRLGNRKPRKRRSLSERVKGVPKPLGRERQSYGFILRSS